MSKYTKSDQFLDQINIVHGPRDILARFFLQAVLLSADADVFYRFGDHDELVALNKRNLGSWFPLTTSFRADTGGLNEFNSIVMFGDNRQGETVATHSIKLLDWPHTNFKREAESLRFFYADPDTQKASGESCRVDAKGADSLSGRLTLTGASWLRPDYRGKKLLQIFNRIIRAYGFTIWGIDESFAILVPVISENQPLRRYGYQSVENGIVLRGSPTSPDKELMLALGRMDNDTFINDLFCFIMDSAKQIDAAVIADRSA